MSNNINNSQAVNSQPSQNTVDTSNDVNDVTGASDVRDPNATKHKASADGYGVVPQGVRGNVLSSQAPVPTDTESTGPNALRSANSKVSYLGEGKSVGNQALALGAENPISNVNALMTPQHQLFSGSNASSLSGQTNTTAASTASSTTTSTATGAKAIASPATTAPTSADPAADAAEATKHSDKWFNGVKCHHKDQDQDIARETGLPQATATQAYKLMKNDSTTDDRQTMGVALAVLAQEKKDGSPSYEADKKIVTDALKVLSDNADNRGSGADASTHIKAYEGALATLSKVTTNRLGTDPAGTPRGSGATDAFDPTKKPVVVNSWA